MIKVNRGYINKKLLGAVLLIASSVAIYLAFYHVLLLLPYFAGVALLFNEKEEDKRLRYSGFAFYHYLFWALIFCAAYVSFPSDLFETVKVWFDNTFFVVFICISIFFSYLTKTELELLGREEKLEKDNSLEHST